MSFWFKLKSHLPHRRRALEDDMREELESLAALSDAEGERTQVGSLALAAERARSAWTWIWIEQLSADLRYASRAMRRNPGLTLIAVSSLALGIGANTAIFSLMHAILTKSLPVGDPARLALLTSYSKDAKIGDFGYGDYLALRRENGAFSGIVAASTVAPIAAGLGGDAETVRRKIVSDNYFSVLQVTPLRGRAFEADEEDQPFALISDGFWRRSFGASPGVVGRQLELDGKLFTIVGVVPPQFLSETVGESVDVWTTIALMPPDMRRSPGYTWLNLIGRLRPGVTIEQASASVRPIASQIPNRFIERIEVEPGAAGSAALRNTFSAPLKILMGIVAAALLIACANLASLLLARAATRQREIATRLALGASRARIMRQLLAESIVLSICGGIVGLWLSVAGERLLLALVSGAGKTVSLDLRPDLPVLLFNLGISLATGLLFGVAPAIHAVWENVAATIRINAPGTSFGSGLGLRGGLIAIQAALSMVLLIAGSLFAQSLRNLKQQDLGIHSANLLAVEVGPQAQYRPNWPTFARELLHRVEAVPGVKSACVSFDEALGDAGGIRGFRLEGSAADNNQRIGAAWVSPRYFETLGIPLIEGREFSAADNANSPPAVIVNHAMALRYVGTDHVIGRHITFDRRYEIIGVAGDTKHGDLRKPVQPFAYFAALQSGTEIHSLEIRTAVSPFAVAATIRRIVREVDPRMRVAEFATLDQVIDQKLAREVLIADLAGFFALVTLLLVILGVYGTVAYSVARRTREIAIRMALGARAADITRSVVRQLTSAIFAGLTAGTAIALIAGRLIAALLFGLKPTDAGTVAVSAVILCVTASIAAFLPVRRACRLDPMSALRLE